MARTISYFSSSTRTASASSMPVCSLVAAGILPERVLEVLGDADVVHDQPGGLVAEDAVDAGDGLHQPVALHRLVDIHRVHAGRVEAGQPHVADDHQLERVRRVLGALGEQFAPRLWPLADVRLPSGRIGGRAGHHHLDRAGLVVVAVPFRAQLHDGVVERHADAAAHADDHRLAVERRRPGPRNASPGPRRPARGASRSRPAPRRSPICA